MARRQVCGGVAFRADGPNETLLRVVRETGLEPARLSTPDPKSGASANSATRACVGFVET